MIELPIAICHGIVVNDLSYIHGKLAHPRHVMGLWTWEELAKIRDGFDTPRCEMEGRYVCENGDESLLD